MEKNTATVKVDTEDNWKKAINYVPNQFTILVYQYDDAPPKLKIGDGVHTVNELPFLVSREVKNNTLII